MGNTIDTTRLYTKADNAPSELVHDHAVAESFFSLLKTERIKRKIHKTRNEVRAKMFNYIEFYCNANRRHGNNGGVSSEAYEKQYYEKLSAM